MAPSPSPPRSLRAPGFPPLRSPPVVAVDSRRKKEGLLPAHMKACHLRSFLYFLPVSC
ncbi:hypothetical protein PVAP13_4NG075219 [Panicum virgatum]|uniref:Uncharacterized protein n=1 Tax=Panicum virgatum TaxID=38727 RepID=A0A8T0TBF7_PANVG|nr:hypothetical protein PVAP13_4NG075219 [Panicum virgatum]